MSSTLSKKIETVANVGIIALTLSVGGILVKRQFFSTPSTASASGAASISNPAGRYATIPRGRLDEERSHCSSRAVEGLPLLH